MITENIWLAYAIGIIMSSIVIFYAYFHLRK